MTTGYRIGVRGCQHLGYTAAGMRLHKDTRWNLRVVDGHVAHEQTMRDMLAAGVDGIVDGGDLTHFNRPLPRDIEAANRVDDLRVASGVWAVGNSGNHCAGGGSDLSAMSVMHRPDLGIRAVYPDPARRNDGIGPYPGLYEIHTAATNPALPDGIALHFISHYGLDKGLTAVGVDIDPMPLPGHVNVFFSHGVFATDERLFQCIDPHGEERTIPGEWAQRGWDAMILSHYHTMGAVPGYETGERGQVWYTGSSLRRGFSDEPGPRGWVLVTVTPSGSVTVEAKPIWQRPQHDLPVIDAAGLTVADVDDLVTAHLSGLTMEDHDTAQLTTDGGAILRQRVFNTTATQRQGLAALTGRYLNLTAAAASWKLDVTHRAAAATGLSGGAGSARSVTARVTDFGAELVARSDTLTHAVGVPLPLRKPVLAQAATWVEAVTVNTDIAETDQSQRQQVPA